MVDEKFGASLPPSMIKEFDSQVAINRENPVTDFMYVMQKGFMTTYGATYLLSLGLAIGVTIRMRDTVEAVAA